MRKKNKKKKTWDDFKKKKKKKKKKNCAVQLLKVNTSVTRLTLKGESWT